MRFIDFDGVILDTEDVLFYEWRKNPDRHNLPNIAKVNYIKDADWNYILNNSPEINDSFYILKNLDPNKSAILTKVHSLDNEGAEKVKFIRSKGIEQPIFLVPYFLKKSDIVDAQGNILIDDSLKNLTEWLDAGGYPMFFDKKEDNVDSWGQPNTRGYQRVLRINEKRNNRR